MDTSQIKKSLARQLEAAAPADKPPDYEKIANVIVDVVEEIMKRKERGKAVDQGSN